MKKVTFVVLLLLLSANAFANAFEDALWAIESEWANIYYKTPADQQRNAFDELYRYADKVAAQYPDKAEPITWKAIIMATNAGNLDALSALNAIKQARNLLDNAIKIDRETLDGSALVTLATLYYMTPGWPIAFGDKTKAEELLLAALKINPNGIDTNYFYADYLLGQNRTDEAEIYFTSAIKAPKRKQQDFADTQLQNEALEGLKKAQQRKANNSKNLFLSFFQTGNAK